MRCALIEFNAYHEEVLPTFVWLLNRLGIEPDVYMVHGSARRKPFGLLRDLRFRPRAVEQMDRYRRLPYRLRRYDLEIINSTEPIENLERVAGSTRPLLGVIHNTALLTDDPAYSAFFERRRRLPILMGRHIAEHVAPSMSALPWMSHVVFGTPPRRSATDLPGVTTFVVSGNVEYSRRNYRSLLDAATALHGEARPFRIRIVGRSTVRDGTAFRAEVERRGLSDSVEFSPRDANHPDFFRLVADADFSLPLIDTTDDRYRPYLETKLASSVPFAIGLGVPLIANDAMVSAYAIDGTGISYEDGRLADAMRRALESTPSERSSWRDALARKRQEILDQSLESLRQAIGAVTGTTPRTI